MAKIMTRKLGRSGIKVSAMGLGCWAIGGPSTNMDGVPVGWSDVDDNESIRAIHHALDLGVNFFDTADVYGTGHSEEILGKSLAGWCDRVVIATKFGNVFNSETRQCTSEDGSPEYMCEEKNLASINRSPLAMGLLTGKFQEKSRFPANDVRRHVDWFEGFKDGKPNPEWLKKLDAIREILTSGSRTLAQGALAWIWGRSEQTIPIPGFKTVQQVKENATAMQFGPLSAKQMREIDDILGDQSTSL